MSVNYAYKTRDAKFILKEWLPVEEIFSLKKFRDFYSLDDIDTIIDQVDKIAREMYVETANDVEKNPITFENGKVSVPGSYRKLFKYYNENGWGISNIDEKAEGNIPFLLRAVFNEICGAAHPAFQPYVALTEGAAGLIQSFGNEDVKKMFLPKMFDGTWAGTMCLTEPSAGSDVGDILSKAFPTENPCIYKIKGNKIFITGGDGDHADNVIHLYLARIEGAVPGTKGISLFIVPKYWVNEDGSLQPNDVQTTGIEHKLGNFGSVTAALAFGDNNGCRGWLLGNYDEQNGIGQGMAQMFQMMNEERLFTGILANAVASNAYLNAAEYTKERIQGRPITDPRSDRIKIINHEDIKRMLLLNKATTEACRAIIMKTAYYIEILHSDDDPQRRQTASDMVECLTPLAKAYPSDEAWNLICESIQAYGGYGYCEEYPVAQAARDCKIYSIWEGTNYIQSMDLLGRKWTMKKGVPFAAFLRTVEDFLRNEDRTGWDKEFSNLERAFKSYLDIVAAISKYQAEGRLGLAPVFSRRILTATAQLFGGMYLLDQAKVANNKLKSLGSDHYDADFYQGKVLSAQYYLNNIIPNVWAVAELVLAGDTSVIEARPEIFNY